MKKKRELYLFKDYFEDFYENQTDKVKNKNLKSLDQFVNEKIGKRGTEKREEFEIEYDAFKLGVLIQQERIKGLHKSNWLN